MDRTTDRVLLELISRATPGKWAVASDEKLRFFIYRQDSSPIRYVIREVPDEVSNFDLRLMGLAKELAEEVLELRKKQRLIFDKL